MTLEASFTEVFTGALRGTPCAVVGLDDRPVPLPVADWTRPADETDQRILDLCSGPTLDIGCGPGRLTEALGRRGQIALGIDVVDEAVAQTLERGGSALRRDVFGHLPGEGRWRSALLADGNVGIGGDPVTLLRRVRQVLDPRGRVVAELAAPGVPSSEATVFLEAGGLRSRPFRWAVVGVDDAPRLAASADLAVDDIHHLGDRWVAVMQEAS